MTLKARLKKLELTRAARGRTDRQSLIGLLTRIAVIYGDPDAAPIDYEQLSDEELRAERDALLALLSDDAREEEAGH